MNDRRSLLAAAGLMALGSIAGADDAPSDKPKRPPLQRVAPDAPLGRMLDGTELKLSDHDGKVVVVSFWASWCPYCREEFPYLDRLQRAAPDRIKVVSVNTEERDIFRKLSRALAEHVQLTLTYDPSKVCQQAFEAPGSLPYTVVLRRDCSVAGIKTGWGESSLKSLVATVNAALAADAA
ncbi:MAG: TlpA family protein disulfide reductase [Burkholderiales bacterium]|jgi:thiol-disulfide isomerase/thioredoxin|nr:TlpA family protein disulfide reductase [Burkholderiales bacterium]